MPVSMEKLQAQAPELVSMRKAVNVSLTKAGLDGTKAKVAIIIDRSGSMGSLYSGGVVQLVSETVLALATAFDDDGDIDMFQFGTDATYLGTLDITDYEGGVNRLYGRLGWGSTNYAAAIKTVADHYRDERSSFPAYVAFVTDGAPDSEPAAMSALKNVARDNTFWQFIGISPRKDPRKSDFPFLNKLREKHAGFITVGVDERREERTVKKGLFRRESTETTSVPILSTPNDQLYDQLLTSGYNLWLRR